METAEIINNYEKILRKPKKVSFMGTVEEPDEEKIKLVKQYLNIIKKYKSKGIPVVITEKSETICENCQKTVEKIDGGQPLGVQFVVASEHRNLPGRATLVAAAMRLPSN